VTAGVNRTKNCGFGASFVWLKARKLPAEITQTLQAANNIQYISSFIGVSFAQRKNKAEDFHAIGSCCSTGESCGGMLGINSPVFLQYLQITTGCLSLYRWLQFRFSILRTLVQMDRGRALAWSSRLNPVYRDRVFFWFGFHASILIRCFVCHNPIMPPGMLQQIFELTM